MMQLNQPPAPDKQGLSDYYQRCASEGSVFSGTIVDQSYDLADSFDPAWGVAALCWCAGGTEIYDFLNGETIRLRAGAVLAIGENERYAWSACGSRPFRSAMIVFPRALTRSLARDFLDDATTPANSSPVISTGLFKPDPNLRKALHAMSRAMHNDSATPEHLEEQATLVASRLISVQQNDSARPTQLSAVKRTTREELCKRLRRAVMLMHDAYNDCSMDLDSLAREACIARHHFVRVFSAAYGTTPLRYLSEVRMEAAARLLESMDMSVTEVANTVGYSNRSAFQRRFRRHFDASPSSWSRLRCQGHHNH